jgi:superfamily I DNA and RNA helicase
MNEAPNKYDKDRRESWDRNVEAAVDQARNAGSLDQFMQIVAQGTSSQKKTNGVRDAVTLSTCHAAKGLEWPVVFVSSVEQRHFPHHEALDVEEERRLLFVAATRAKEHLSLTYRVNDRFGVAPSMFLWDMNHQDDGLFAHLQMFEDLDACDAENTQGSDRPSGGSVIQWTEKADRLLTQRISEGESVDEIAVAFGVARREIEGRLSQLKAMPAS